MNRVTNALREAAAAKGELPLEYMLRVMRDTRTKPARRDDMAKAAAQYLHPRLNSVTHSGDANNPLRMITATMSPQEAAAAYIETLKAVNIPYEDKEPLKLKVVK